MIPGKNIADAFLSPLFRHRFSRVVVFTRDTSSPVAKELAGNGADVVKVTLTEGDTEDAAALKTALQGVDVLVNALASREAAAPGMDILAKAAIDAGVKVYFPSEFGVWVVLFSQSQ